MSEKLFEVPNLDCLSVDAEDYKEAARVLHKLYLYCEYRRTRFERAAEGNMVDADYCDRMTEKIYQSLPDWAKW